MSGNTTKTKVPLYDYVRYINLSILAGIAAHMQQPQRAARRFGFVEELLKTERRRPDWVERREFERGVGIVRAALSPKEYSRLWTEGSSMDLEEVIQEARAIAAEVICSYNDSSE